MHAKQVKSYISSAKPFNTNDIYIFKKIIPDLLKMYLYIYVSLFVTFTAYLLLISVIDKLETTINGISFHFLSQKLVLLFSFFTFLLQFGL